LGQLTVSGKALPKLLEKRSAPELVIQKPTGKLKVGQLPLLILALDRYKPGTNLLQQSHRTDEAVDQNPASTLASQFSPENQYAIGSNPDPSARHIFGKTGFSGEIEYTLNKSKVFTLAD
jgi:hypothetical protein